MVRTRVSSDKLKVILFPDFTLQFKEVPLLVKGQTMLLAGFQLCTDDLVQPSVRWWPAMNNSPIYPRVLLSNFCSLGIFFYLGFNLNFQIKKWKVVTSNTLNAAYYCQKHYVGCSCIKLSFISLNEYNPSVTSFDIYNLLHFRSSPKLFGK